MKKKISGLFSMLLAAVMVLSMAVTGLAAEIQPYAHSGNDDNAITGSITIVSAAQGETYDVYQIFEMTYVDFTKKNDENPDGQEESDSYSYKVVSAWWDFIESYTYDDSGSPLFELDENGYLKSSSAVFDSDVATGDVMSEFARAALEYAAGDEDEGRDKIEPTESAQADENGTASFTELDLGYYLVDTSLGSLCFLDSTDADVTITEKNGYPTLSKKVHENTDADDVFGADDDADNNADVLFQIEIDDINGSVNLVLHDSMDDELELIYDDEKDPDHETPSLNETVYLYTKAGAEPVALEAAKYDDKTESWVNGDYYITVGECTVEGCPLETCAFEIHFLRDFNDVDASGYIILTYELHLDTDSDTYNEDEEEIDNFALVSYGATSYSVRVQAETWTFGFEVVKYTDVDGEDGYTDGTDKPLEDAEFELTNADGEKAYFIISDEGKYILEGWGPIPEGEEDEYTSTITSGSDGMIYVEGLDAATYVLEETKAPDGYNRLTHTITITIKETKDEATGLIDGHTVTYYNTSDDEDEPSTAEDNIIPIENNQGAKLPGTGGIGTTIFYVVGVILVLGAAVLFVTKKRLDKEQ